MPEQTILSKHFGAWGKDEVPAPRNQGQSIYHDTLLRLPVARLVELLESAHATNRRLHRRCQEAEHAAHEATRRYAAIQRPLTEAQGRAQQYARSLKALYNQEFKNYWRACLLCRATWRVKAWVRRWL
jgi:hypothetical protein